jgi:hypothetical protein
VRLVYLQYPEQMAQRACNARFLRHVLFASIAFVAACGGSVDSPGNIVDGGVDGSADGSTHDTLSTDVAPGDTTPAADVVTDTAPPDTGAPLTDTCASVGGKFCTAVRWELCPIGYEPSDKGDGHFGCGTIQGWCCVPAPASSCTASGKGNCVPGGCTGCWTAVTDTSLSCESGRSCCIDNCD